MVTNGYESLKAHFLKVNINCQGCKQKVKKLLRKLEGVYSVDIDTEHHMVMVTGSVDPLTLVRRLLKSGKHAEVWPFSNQVQNHYEMPEAENSNRMQYLGSSVHTSINEHKNPIFVNEVKDEWSFYNNLGADMREQVRSEMRGTEYQRNDPRGTFNNFHRAYMPRTMYRNSGCEAGFDQTFPGTFYEYPYMKINMQERQRNTKNEYGNNAYDSQTGNAVISSSALADIDPQFSSMPQFYY